jgi:diguanylate cyclase (GGDEF)-like protein
MTLASGFLGTEIGSVDRALNEPSAERHLHSSSDKLRELQQTFLGRLSERYDELEACLTAFLEDGEEHQLSEFRRQAHNLGGSCGSYGYSEVGRVAQALEHVASNWRAGEEVDPRLARRLLGLMRREIYEAEQASPRRAAPGVQSALPAAGSVAVYLLEDEPEMAELVAEQLQPYGYAVTPFSDSASLLEAVRSHPPSALIFDVRLSGTERGPATARRLPLDVRKSVPIVFLSAHRDLDSRVEAVRAGAAAYLTKPPNITEIVDLLDRVTRNRQADPYRVLVVDDMVSTAKLYAAALEDGGMVTRVAGDARQAMAAIDDFGPEIILLDLYMPEISGDELAQVIRQYPSLLPIPIVFLSAEHDEPTQIAALDHGGDAFITKPVDLDHLTASVRVRAQRYRTLRSSMQRDGLTGLLNHRHAKESLEAELARARRTGSPLSVAMLDIDHFKNVNDTHGHPVGDQVIRSLARILTQRLRRSDVIGRYGGEEFIVLLPDTPGDHAATVLDELRQSFSVLTHQGTEGTFSCSLSCGVTAALPDSDGVDSVIARADQALYRAKEGGRDRVERS